MIHRQRLLREALLLFLLASCLVFLLGCPKDAYRASAQASDGVAQSVHAALTIDVALYRASEIDAEYARELAEVLKAVNFANEEFIVDAKAIHAAAGGQAAYLTAAQKVVDSAAQLNQEQVLQGILRIKNSASRAKMTAALSAVQLGVRALILSIEGAKP